MAWPAIALRHAQFLCGNRIKFTTSATRALRSTCFRVPHRCLKELTSITRQRPDLRLHTGTQWMSTAAAAGKGLEKAQEEAADTAATAIPQTAAERAAAKIEEKKYKTERSKQMPDPVPIPPFALEVLRGMGQVVLCNSTLTGAFVICGLYYGDSQVAGLAVVGCAAATATARLISSETSLISSGLMGYNGALLGAALACYGPLQVIANPVNLVGAASALGCSPASLGPAVVVGGTMLAGAASVFLVSILGAVLGSVPQLTLAFSIIALAVMGVLVMKRPRVQHALDDARKSDLPKKPANHYNLSVMSMLQDPLFCLEISFAGLAQILSMNEPITGILISFGIAGHSMQAAAAAMSGSAIGALCAASRGAPAEDIEQGLWGYNSALTALAVSIFLVPLGWPVIVLGWVGAVFAAAATHGFKEALGNFQLPCFTLPSCFVATSCLLLAGRVPGFVRARAPHSPEVNLQAYQSGF